MGAQGKPLVGSNATRRLDELGSSEPTLKEEPPIPGAQRKHPAGRPQEPRQRGVYDPWPDGAGLPSDQGKVGDGRCYENSDLVEDS